MGAGNTDRIFIGLHDLAPCLCALKNRDAGSAGSSDLRIVVVCSSGADDAVSALNIFGSVTDGHLNTLTDQFIRGNRSIHIGTRDQHAHALQHQSKRAHGNAADANKMHMLSRSQIIFHMLVMFSHVYQISRCWFHNPIT